MLLWSMFNRSPYHLVSLSPWPFYVPFFALGMAVGAIAWFHTGYWCYGLLNFSFWFLAYGSYMWWRDVVRESNKMGYHTFFVTYGLRIGVLLFITSEIMFFFAFFWGFFHGGSESMEDLKEAWPSSGLEALSIFDVPLLNTLVLLSSGMTLTFAHIEVMEGNRFTALFYMVTTVFLGIYFTFLQWGEYIESDYGFSDNTFSSVFYIATGFHGLHVLIGSTFLVVTMSRIIWLHFNDGHHIGFEAAVWYWHFVDVVWMFLFLSVYWWGF